MTPSSDSRRRWLRTAAATGVAALLASCSVVPTAPPPPGAKVSQAGSAREYRRDAASHLYALNSARIYRGVMPPMLYAIGVLQVDIDRAGRVLQLKWLRAPTHAPEVVAEIERTVRQAAPFPSPGGTVSYTDTWLWDRSGRFQLDTLTEGQRNK